MKRFIPFLFLTCLAGSATAQNGDLFSAVAMRFLSQPANYLKPLDTLLSLHSTMGKDARMQPRFFNELATYSSFIGNYHDALRYYDSAGFREQVPASPSGLDAFSGYRSASARQTIIHMAASRQVTVINEAHHVPYHRLFTKSLLQELYNAGYRYFSLELFKLQEPSVFVKADSLWNFAPADRSCDVLVFHPPYGTVQGRPDYYRLDAARKPVTLRLKKAYRHVLAQAYISIEKNADRLPVDQLLLEQGNEGRLMLVDGEYDVVVRDGGGEMQETQILTVQ